MKKIFLSFLIATIMAGVICISCKKERSCEECRENNKPPIALAGSDQVISLPVDSILLDGSNSSDPDGKISEWLWTKISGPSPFTIANKSASKTIARNLIVGVYQFELKVTDDKGLSARDTLMITVDNTQTTNHPPMANAGRDTIITLPANSVSLDGTASADPDNNIINYQWTKIAGSLTFDIVNINTVQTQVNNLVEGVYQFELNVTDAGGLSDKDTVQVTVNPQLPTLPVCNNDNRPTVNAQLIFIGTLSQARADITVASVGSKILFAGGYGSQEYSRVDIYDMATNTWSTAELSLARAWIGAVTAGNKIFFAGGQFDGFSSNVVDIYDASTNSWTITHLSRGADALAATTVGNKVFFAGGNWGMYATDVVDIYDLTGNTWSTATLSTRRNFITAASANNKVYFSGGYDASFKPSNVIDIYDNSTGTWSTSSLQVPRNYHAGVTVNNVVYFAGSNPANCSVETLDATSGGHTLMNLFNPGTWFPDAGQNAVVKDNKIIFLRHDGGASANKFDIYNVQTNTWSIGVLPQPIPAGASVISVNNTIYVGAGKVNGVLSNKVWKLEF